MPWYTRVEKTQPEPERVTDNEKTTDYSVNGATDRRMVRRWLRLANGRFEGDLQNLPSLQNGFKLYTNYCMGCHGLQFQRYQRTADDLGIPHDLALKNLIFTGQKIGDLMTTAMPKEESKAWFGAAPPDLTMVTRVREPHWVYNYLKTFYADESRPLGVNNKVFANVGMPNVLLDLQESAASLHGRRLRRVGGGGRDRRVESEEFDAAIYD